MMSVLQTPVDILDDAVLYLRVYFVGFPFCLCIIFFQRCNTEKLVKGIAEECQVDLIDAVKQPDADLSSYDTIGFASGIYSSKFHQSILGFAEKNLPDDKRYF